MESVDVSCQTESLWTAEKQDKYRQMKKRIIELLAKQREVEGALETNCRKIEQLSRQLGQKPRYRVNWRIPRMTDGTVQLPIQLGALKILELGRIEHERSQFHNERYIFPIGYTAERIYASTTDPLNTTVYTCKIEDGSDGPLFTLTAADQQEFLTARTATGVWVSVLRKVNEMRERKSSNTISGPEYFGLTNPFVKEMIEELPNAEKKCMSIDAIVDNHSALPPSPPNSCSSRSPSPDYCGKQPHPPMSAEERRYRNKLASAKYRAKKQASMKNMSTKVSQLMTTNHQLSRELAKVKQENEILRTMYERVITQQQSQLYSLPPIHLNH
ncbi:hypothetical protein G6F43_008417 [Rhizopus delemar]|nr:hypothetical protein G6F43_008417 [Rhizopus delemar]